MLGSSEPYWRKLYLHHHPDRRRYTSWFTNSEYSRGRRTNFYSECNTHFLHWWLVCSLNLTSFQFVTSILFINNLKILYLKKPSIRKPNNASPSSILLYSESVSIPILQCHYKILKIICLKPIFWFCPKIHFILRILNIIQRKRKPFKTERKKKQF